MYYSHQPQGRKLHIWHLAQETPSSFPCLYFYLGLFALQAQIRFCTQLSCVTSPLGTCLQGRKIG